MGCNTSKLDDEETVQLCKDRKRFIKQAVEQRTRFDSGHLDYIQSLKRVSAALRNYVEGDEPGEFLLDSFITPPFVPVKKTTPGFFSILQKSFSAAPIQSEPTLKVNYLKSGGSQSVSVEERHQSPETFRVETYSPMHHYGVDGFFAMQSSPMYSSFFSYSPNNRPNIPPTSPQNSQWDGFWNPFSSLDYYGYPNRSSLDQMLMDDGTRGLRQVREEEGIPDLEVETEQEDSDNKANMAEERPTVAANYAREVLIEEEGDETDSEYRCEYEVEGPQAGLQSQGSVIELSWSQNSGKVEIRNQEMAAGDAEAKEETPGYTVYVNEKPTSMAEVIKDLEDQFAVVCNSAKEVSDLSESSRAKYPSASNDLTAMKMLNPVALLRSASSWSSPSRFLMSSSSSKDEDCDSSSDFSEESCMFSGSHQSTLDRLFAWEKKLYQEVRHGERVRIAYEKKCMQLRNQAVQGEDPSVLDKTRAAIRDLHTQIKVSLHSVEAVSKRIEILRDEELQPQLLELVQGLGRMWKVMAECHQSQKRTLDQAKLLLAGMPSKHEAKRNSSMTVADPQRLARSASNLETELRNWRACFEAWIISQRSYMQALTGWLLQCVRTDPDTSKLLFSPCRSSGIFQIFGLCIQWSKFLDAMQEMPVLDGLDFFAAGMGSIHAQQLRDDPHRLPIGSKRFGGGLSIESCRSMELLEAGEVEDIMTTERMAEVAIKVLCTGMSAAMSSLIEFAIGSAEGYAELVKQWESTKSSQRSSRAGA